MATFDFPNFKEDCEFFSIKQLDWVWFAAWFLIIWTEKVHEFPQEDGFKGATPRFFDECYFVVTIIIHVIKLPIEYTHQKHEDKYRTTKVY